MIDNINIIKPLLNFEKEGDFYMLYVFKRKKDQPENEKENNQSVRTIKTYIIESVKNLEDKYDEIKMLCEVFKARAYIHVQKQNHFDVSLNMLIELTERIKSGHTNQKHLFSSVVGKIKILEKRWIIDIDTKDEDEINQILNYINEECRPIGNKVEAIIPTREGCHLITAKFDSLKFKEKYSNIDIQKKNPTLLFLPDSLNY